MARFRWAAAFAALAVTCSGTLGASGPAAEVGMVPPPTAPPAAAPPPVDGAVLALAHPGGRIVAGGNFATAASPDETVTYPRTNLMAFDIATGAVDAGFAPRVDGAVRAVVPAADGTSVYVGGDFTHVDGRPMRGVARLDLTTGAAVPGFVAPAVDGPVRDLGLAGGRLFLAGDFTTPGGGLAAVDAETGTLDPSVGVRFSPAAVSRLAVSAGTLVAVGPFTSVDGAARPHLAVLDLSGGAATVSSFATDRYGPGCAVNDVDLGPGYAVVVTGGGSRSGTLCGTAARWDITAGGSGQEPVWVDRTGGAGLQAVAVTGSAVYVAGEQRWLNNPLGVDGPGPGAIEAPDIAALDPRNGLPVAWRPGRTPGPGTQVLDASPAGVWAGGDRGSARDRLTVLPLAGPLDGPPVAESTGGLPGTVFLAGPLQAGGESDALVARGLDPGRTPPEAAAVPVPGATGSGDVRGAVMTDGTLWTGHRDGTFTRRSFDGQTLGPETPVDLHGLSAVADELGRTTGMFFSDGRLYFTLAGEPGLFYRYFTPGSAVVGGERFTATGNLPDLDWRHVAGMTLAGDRLLWADAGTGVLRSAPFAAGAPVAGGAVVSTADWRARGLFVRPGSAAGPAAPTAEVRTTCAALACRFTASGPDAAYAWDFGDGATGAGTAATHTYPDPGRYTVTLTLTDTAGRLATATREVDVSVGDGPVAAFTAACTGRVCTLDAGSTTGTISAYRWELGDGSTGTGALLTHTYGADGTYPVSLTVTGTGGSGTTTRDVVATVATSAPITFRDGAAVAVQGTSATVTVPPTVRSGDALLLFVTGDSATVPSGWELVDRVSGALPSALYRRVAADTDPGSAVTVTVPESARLDVALLAYAGAAALPARAVGAAAGATPSVEVAGPGAWTVSYWAGGDPPLTAPAGVVARTSVAALVGDSGGPVASGPYGGLVASGTSDGTGDGTATTAPESSSSASPAVAWTVVLAPG